MRRFGASFSAEEIYAISGKPVDITPLPLPDGSGCVRDEPHLLDRAAYVAEVHGYLCFRLTGRWTTSTASADPMGILDMERLVWSQDILAAAGVSIDKMLPLVRPGTFIGTVTEGASEVTDLSRPPPPGYVAAVPGVGGRARLPEGAEKVLSIYSLT